MRLLDCRRLVAIRSHSVGRKQAENLAIKNPVPHTPFFMFPDKLVWDVRIVMISGAA